MANAIFRSTSLRVDNAAAFAREFYPKGGALNLDNHLYCMIGREDDPVGTDPATNLAYASGAGVWPDDGVPPMPQDTRFYDRQFWSMAIGGKRIDPSDIALMAPRKSTTSWITGTTYDVYSESDAALYTNANFYCMNQFFEVFALVKKAPSATVSLTEPVFYSTIINPATQANVKVDGAVGFVYFNDSKQSIIETAEGYTWKYLYTLSAESITDLLQSDWLPVNFGNTRWSNTGDVRYTQSQDSVTTSGSEGYAYKILGARYVLVRCLLNAGLSGSGLLPAGLEYRQVAFVKNPRDNATANRATFSIGIQPNTVVPAGGTNKFVINTGDLIYIENKSPVFRQVDQTEQVKVMMEF
jgi:hypothetical protein